MSNTLSGKVSGSMSSRGWAIAVGAAAIVLAAILLVVYLDRYRARVSGEGAPTQVLVANRLIKSGTPGTIVGTQGYYTITELARRDIELDAISDPTYLLGRAAAVDILPGQQLTTADFAATTSTTVKTQLVGPQRAFSIAIDNVHASASQLAAGDFVDVYVGVTGTVRLFRSNIKILAVPTPEGGNMVLRIHTRDAADWVYVADNAQLTFVLRPVVGAKPTPRDSASSVLSGT